MKTTHFYFISIFCLLFVFIELAGCSAVQEKPIPTISKTASVRDIYQPRPPIRNSSNTYEGSLWRNDKNESAFGNVLRDHRAKFRRQLLTINDLGSIISVPTLKEKTIAPANVVQQTAVALEALTLWNTLQEEQNDIMRSLNRISVEVTRVLSNGNMVVKGRKVDYRQRNQVRYITTVTGILRPVDVDDTNTVSAVKLVYPEVKIKRQVIGSLLRKQLRKLAPLLGKQNAGLLERLSDFSKAKN